MLPAHMYPKLREHPNLAGHYGGAWQKQKQEFARFGGPVVATTNCILIPKRRLRRPHLHHPLHGRARRHAAPGQRLRPRHRQGQKLPAAARRRPAA